MGVALENARLFDEIQQRNAELAIINSVQEGLVAQMDMQAIYDLVGDKIRDIFDAQGVMIGSYDHAAGTHSVPYLIEKGERFQPETNPINALHEHLIESGETVLMNENVLERAADYGLILVDGSAVSKSAVWVPMSIGDQVEGFVSLQNPDREHAFSESDIRLLTTLANSMIVALESARRFKQIQQRNAELAIINAVQEGLVARLDMDAMYELVGETVRATFEVEGVFICAYDESSDMLSYPYEIEQGVRGAIPPRTLGTGLTSHVIRNNIPLRFGTQQETVSGEFGALQMPSPGAEKSLVESWLGVPLRSGKRVTGIIAVQSHQPHRFDENDERLLSTIAASTGLALESARRFEQIQQRNAELAIINSVQEGLVAQMEMQAIYDLVGDKIRDIFDAQVVTLNRFDHEKRLSEYWYTYEKGERQPYASYPFTPLNEALIESGRTWLANESMAEILKQYKHDITRGGIPKSNLTVPLRSGDTVSGYVSLQNTDREHAFSEADVRLLETLANSMSVALESARRFEQVQQALARESATREILGIVASSPTDVQPVLDAITESAARLAVSHDALVALVEDDFLRIAAHHGTLEMKPVGGGIPINPESVAGVTILEGKPHQAIHHWDNDEEESKYPIGDAVAQEYGYRMTFTAPLIRQGKVIGVIAVRRQEAELLMDEEVALMQSFADQAVIALDNTRLFNETKRLLEETQQRNAELAVINAVQEGLVAELDIADIYELVGEKIRTEFEADTAYIAIIDEARQQFLTPYHMENGHRHTQPPFPIDRGLTGRIIATGEPLKLNTLADQSALDINVIVTVSPGEEEDRNESFLGVPIRVSGQVTGVLSVQSHQPHRFDENDVRLLSTIAASMGLALESARRFEQIQQRNAELAIINGVQEGLVAQMEMQAIYELVGEKIRDIFDAQAVTINRFDHDARLNHYEYVIEKGERFSLPPRPFTGLGRTSADRRIVYHFGRFSDRDRKTRHSHHAGY